MTVLYADTSAVVRAYFPHEEDHTMLRQLLLTGADPVVTSELTRLELASAVAGAHRARLLAKPTLIVDQFDNECGDEGTFTLLSIDSDPVLARARQLIAEHPLRSLDAIHLATALTKAVAIAMGEPVTMVTRDQRLAQAARACELAVL